MKLAVKEKSFINKDKLYELANGKAPSESQINEILNKAMKLKGLGLEDTAMLLRIEDEEHIKKVMETAGIIKDKIYGRRMVLFAPLYVANKCSNDCLYCGFRIGNKSLVKTQLSMKQIEMEVKHLLRDGHKRLLMLQGESYETSVEYFLEALRVAYDTKEDGAGIRRINVEIAPLEVDEFKQLKKIGIGTYACFQETYDPDLYKDYHRAGPKRDYENRLFVMDRAMEGDIDDVGIGVLFGLADYKFEVLAMMEHAKHLEERFGCGPHTISVPRIEPAEGAPVTQNIPYPVSDRDFKKLVSIIRIASPWTGIILSTREKESLRTELFKYGVSQISAGSRTNPGSYEEEGTDSGSQFSLGDHRSLDDVISSLIDDKYIPSFCTGCYRKNRVGADFMDLAKPGLIKDFCEPNGLLTFMEYLIDYASPEIKKKGSVLAEEILKEIPNPVVRKRTIKMISQIKEGERDLYF